MFFALPVYCHRLVSTITDYKFDVTDHIFLWLPHLFSHLIITSTPQVLSPNYHFRAFWLYFVVEFFPPRRGLRSSRQIFVLSISKNRRYVPCFFYSVPDSYIPVQRQQQTIVRRSVFMSPRFQFVPYNNRPSKEDDSVCDFQLLVAFHCDCVRNFEKRQGTGIMQWSSTVKGRIFHAERQVTLYVMIQSFAPGNVWLSLEFSCEVL